MACTYQSITLQPGEVFVLPPNATLVGADDTAQLSSENNCLDLSNVESFECYAVTIGDSSDNGGETPVYDNIVISGIRLDNTEYPFGSPLYITDGSVTIKTRLDETQFGPLIIDVQSSVTIDSDRGTVRYVVFKTLPSIANDFYFYGAGAGVVSDSPTSASVPLSWKVIPYADRDTSGGLAWPVCATT